MPARTLAFLFLAIPGAWPIPPWNNSGHRIVSLLTWAELSDTTRARIAEILTSHPRFREDLQLDLPEGSSAADKARHAFCLASNWPDTVRSATHPMHRAANHPRWHYIDLPFASGCEPPAREPSASNDGPQDLVEAIRKSLTELGNADLPAADRAIALCWVVHLVEDVHQPLHACTLYSPQFPGGDRGGTLFLVTRDVFDPESRTNLHALWDSMLGNYQLPASESALTAGLALRPEFARGRFKAMLAVTDPADWAKESHELAVEHAYLQGKLLGGAPGADGKSTAPPLPKDYLATAERIAMARAVLAAHRLADLLNQVFDHG